MPFLSRRSVDPLISISSPPSRDTGHPQKRHSLSKNLRNRARSDSSLLRRVSTLFAVRRRTSSKVSLSQTHTIPSAGIEYISASHCQWSTLPRLSSDTTTTSSSLEIRRPSGLGRRASLLLSSDSQSSLSSDSFRTISIHEGAYTPPLPNAHSSAARQIPDRSPPCYYAAPFVLPDSILRTLLEFVPRFDLAAAARVSRSFCTAARSALYRTLDSEHMHLSARERLYHVLASRKELAALVVSLYCHAWSCAAPPPDIRQALQNMHNLKSLTLPSFASILSHTPACTFALTHLAILDTRMTASQLVALRSWLATQPALESLSFPHLAECDGDACADALPVSMCAILPRLTYLRASTEIVSVLCMAMAHPVQHLVLDVHATLYTGLRPGAVMCSLQGVRTLHVIFAREVDQRTVEKFLSVTGSVLSGKSGPGVRSLEVEVSWTDDGGAETLYGIVTTTISRFRGLETLKLTSPFRSTQALVPLGYPPSLCTGPASFKFDADTGTDSPARSPPVSPVVTPICSPVRKEFVTCGIERSYARAWTKRCPSLSDIQFDFTCATTEDVELCGVWFRRKAVTSR